jgi:hypothetical protein
LAVSACGRRLVFIIVIRSNVFFLFWDMTQWYPFAAAAQRKKGRKLILPLYNVARECVVLWLLQRPFQEWSQLRRRPEQRHGGPGS